MPECNGASVQVDLLIQDIQQLEILKHWQCLCCESLVQLHVIDVDPQTGEQLGSRVRKAGDYASKEPGDVHMERGGPEGALVLFNLYSPDGLLAQSLGSDGSVIGESTLEQILRGKSAR